MSRRTKLIAVRVGASCTGSGFSSQKTIAHSAAPPFRKRSRTVRRTTNLLRARLQRMSFWCAGVGLLGRIRPHGDNDSQCLELESNVQRHGGKRPLLLGDDDVRSDCALHVFSRRRPLWSV